MQITITYKDGHIGHFETASLKPLGSDALLMECEFSAADAEERGLWVSIHHYDAIKNASATQGETPDASRKRGWRFLLASADEMTDAVEVSIDGRPAATRLGGRLIETAVIDALSRLFLHNADALSIAAKIADLDRYLNNAGSALGIARGAVSHAKTLGIDEDALQCAIDSDQLQTDQEL